MVTSASISHLFLLINLAGVLFLFAPSTFAQHTSVCDTVTDIPGYECEALITFYDNTHGEGWDHNEGWLIDPIACEWYGVDCRNGNISEISLRSNHLTGNLPPELGNLSTLRYLDLGDNQLSGPLPSELSNLAHLKGLNVRNNRLSGEIPPEFGDLVNLEWIYLSQNNLSGLLPMTFTQLANLETLYFRETSLCEPLAPAFQSWLSQIPSVGSSEISCDCRFIQEIPAAECNALFVLFDKTRGSRWNSAVNWLQTLSPCSWEGVTCKNGHVKKISLPQNNLHGALPPEIGNLSYLTVLDLSQNALNGHLLPEIGKLNSLMTLDLSQNTLSGPLPPELGDLTQLVSLDLSHNHFEEYLPPTIGNLSNLTYLDVSHNRFEDSIPLSIGNLAHLAYLDLSDNFFQRGLPPTFDRLTALTYLDLSNTWLRGTLPINFYRFSVLKELHIQQTNLCEPSSYLFRNWKRRLDLFEGTNSVCPLTYQGLLPLVAIIVLGLGIFLPASYQAFRAIFGKANVEPHHRNDYSRSDRQLPRGIPIAILTTGVFGVSAGFFWSIATMFTIGSVVYGPGIGLILYFAFAILVKKARRRTKIKIVGLLLGVLVSLFIALFMLLTVEMPVTMSEIISIAGYVCLIVILVWLMTSGVTTGGYLELIAEGIVLGGIWGAITGGALGELYCHHSPAFYGGMSDMLTYRVFSASLGEEIRRFLANEMTGIFLFSLIGGLSGALTRRLLLHISPLENRMSKRLADMFIPLLRRLRT